LLPDGHRARRLHGHSFVARVRAAIAPGWAGFGGAEAAELRERLERCVAPLDYQLLNEHLEEPTDEKPRPLDQGPGSRSRQSSRPASRARWSKASIWTATNARTCGAATGSGGAPLPNVAPGHKCGRMHGHGFEVSLHARIAPEHTNRFDVERLDRCWAPLHAEFHQACLNDIPAWRTPPAN